MATDLEILKRFQQGDTEVLEDIVRTYQKPLYHFIWRFVGNHEDAADLTQKFFLQAIRYASSFQGISSVKTWLFSIDINQSKNFLRDRGPRMESDVEALPHNSGSDPISRLEQQAERRILHQAITRLPEKQRCSILLRINEEYSFREIGRILGCSERSAKVNFHHGVRALQVILGAYGEGVKK